MTASTGIDELDALKRLAWTELPPITTMTLWAAAALLKSVDLAVLGWAAALGWLAVSRGWLDE